MNTVNVEFYLVEVCSVGISKPLEIEDNVYLTLIIG